MYTCGLQFYIMRNHCWMVSRDPNDCSVGDDVLRARRVPSALRGHSVHNATFL